MSRLVIISHTPHYKNKYNEFVGLESTLREINYLSMLFDELYHVAPLYNNEAHNATCKYYSNNITFIPIVPTGGKKLINKLGIFFYMPYNFYIIVKSIIKADWVHFRAPTNLGLFVLPFMSILYKRKWVKYAGNWTQHSVPISYKLQRWWLKNNLQNSLVTVNGFADPLHSHLLSFKNPCLTEKERQLNKKNGLKKDFNNKITFCFVGRIERHKGFNLLVKAINEIINLDWVQRIHCVGEIIDSELINKIEVKKNNIFKFHGILNRAELNNIYIDSHFIILPSNSEGFPKVIAEASSYGCIPIISKIPSVLYYINNTNGLFLENTNAESIIDLIESIKENRKDLPSLSQNAMKNIKDFTYENYKLRILNEIIQI